jgi:hypothetical protein
MPRRLTDLLGSYGIQAQTAEERGWSGLTNGALVEAAVQAEFTCVLTRDRLFSESAAKALRRFSQFCAILITLPQLRGPQFLDAFHRAWEREPIRLRPGELRRWPVS